MSERENLSPAEPASLPSPRLLEGSWVRLESLAAERHSADIWRAVAGDDHVWNYLADGPYATEAGLHAALEEKQRNPAAFFLAIVPRSSGRAEGYASYMRMDSPNRVIEVGNILMTPRLQRTTAATEAMFLMARHVFEEHRYRRYEWKCNARNEPSRRAALRYGFTFEGVFRQHMIVKGSNRDTAWYSMLDREWPARRAAFERWLSAENFDENGRQRLSLAACSVEPSPQI